MKQKVLAQPAPQPQSNEEGKRLIKVSQLDQGMLFTHDQNLYEIFGKINLDSGVVRLNVNDIKTKKELFLELSGDELVERVPLLEVRQLKTSFFMKKDEAKAVDGISFTLERGKTLGIVGESGSGKSVTAYSIMQILAKSGKIVDGSIRFQGQEMVHADDRFIRSIRGARISIIFQDPMTSLNPVYTIGNQLLEAIRLHTLLSAEERTEKAITMLKMVGVNSPEKRMKQYPFEFSGGMLQRVMIAMALVCEPDILIADEPTTALDVTIQAQILDLMRDLQRKMGMAIIIITHDLGVVADMCDEIAVMYAGRIVEKGNASQIFYSPAHEYTKGLLASIPAHSAHGRLKPIPGSPVDLLNLPPGCRFAPRCGKCMKVCLNDYPPEVHIQPGHVASCWLPVKEVYQSKEDLNDEKK